MIYRLQRYYFPFDLQRKRRFSPTKKVRAPAGTRTPSRSSPPAQDWPIVRCVEVDTSSPASRDCRAGRRFAWDGLFGKNCATGENKCRFCRRGTKKSIPLRPVSYPAMNHGDRKQRTRQAYFVSSACAAAPSGAAGCSLRASVRHGAGRDAVTPWAACDSFDEVLKLANVGEIIQPGGVIIGIRSISFDIQNHTRHAMTPPRRDARADMLRIPLSLLICTAI